MREFCEYWRSKNLPDTKVAGGDGVSDENAPVVKVSKRKAEAKIREIAVYELRPQCYKRKLWYVNDKTLEKLNLSLPVPTEWKWMTLVSAHGTGANTAGVAKQSISVTSVQPSPSAASGTIKSFISSMTPNASDQQSPAGNGVNVTKGSCGVGQSPSRDIQQSTPVSALKVKADNSSSVCTSSVCDSGSTAGSEVGSGKLVRPCGTPSSSSTVKKRKVQSVLRRSLPNKQQPCLLFSKKSRQPVNNSDCVVADSCVNDADNAAFSADEPRAEPDNDDCMIVDSSVPSSKSSTKPDADKQREELDAHVAGSVSDVHMISDEKLPPETDANCNLCVENSNDANMLVEATVVIDDSN